MKNINSNASADQTTFSKSWIPQCKAEFKPRINQVFTSVDEAHQFYLNYGKECGFDVRRTTGKTFKDGSIILKYVVCNRAGKPHANALAENASLTESSKQRNTLSRRCGCNAKISVKFFAREGYKIILFEEAHNHEMVPIKSRHLLNCNRNMTFPHQNYVFGMNKASMGPSKAHNMMKEMVGDYANIGATVTDYRNFQRDIKSYIGKKDADMILEKFLMNRASSDNAFYYEYRVDAEGHLSGLFWADPIGRKNFEIYYDVVSVDATYNTNCYNMVFVPFTGVDNHWKSVTFAAALISTEDLGHYEWMFKAFRKVMGRSPSCIITDQDPAMGATIPYCLPGATHRLCMWHIMKKINLKVGPAICTKTDFLEKINHIIWSEFISEDEFEKSWKSIISHFGLQKNSWLQDMFAMRSSWIPAFFKDRFMVGLLRSTSRSESTNNYFTYFLKPGDTLCEFYMHFQSAIDKQRHIHSLLDKDSTYTPKFITQKHIEKDAANIYTHEIFLKVQEEITKSCYHVRINDIETIDGTKFYKLTDDFHKGIIFQVKVTDRTEVISCTCNLYIRIGYMCSHIFAALYSRGIDKIPNEFIANRWVKNAEKRHDSLQLGEIHLKDDKTDRVRRKVSNIWFNFQSLLSAAGMDEEEIDKIDENLQNLISTSKRVLPKKGVRINDSVIEQLIGGKSEGEVVIKPPTKSRNKGCGKRILSEAEKNAKQLEKAGRKCAKCKIVGSHDARNCPGPNTTPTKKQKTAT